MTSNHCISCWNVGRFPNGTLMPDPTTFPNGIKAVADYVHSKVCHVFIPTLQFTHSDVQGLKFGIYTDRGNQTCAGRAGSGGHEDLDAATFAEWGVDYLKEDSCNASSDHSVAFEEYGRMRDALNAV